MNNSKRVGAVAVTAATLVAGLNGTALASDSISGYRECASKIIVVGDFAKYNSSFFAQHYVNYNGSRYPSTRWYTSGSHSYKFPIPGGGWQAYASNGDVKSAYATCGY